MIQAPFWLRFDTTGELQLIDATGRAYWISGNSGGMFSPPYTMSVGDDGKLAIKDANLAVKWYSH